MSLACVRLTILSVFVLIISIAKPSFGQKIDYEEFSARVDSIFAAETAPDAPGAAVAVIQHGDVIYRRCFGLASLEHGVPITNETVFNLASVTKQFTALAVLLLEREGKLHLDDDIHKYFPELPAYNATVTLRNLMNHTSGLWEYSSMFRYYGGHNPVDYTSIEDVLALLKGQDQLLFAPGSQWQYCNTNYALLGELVARVTCESLASWTKRNIFEPLKMKSTFFRDDCNAVIPHGGGCYYKTEGVYKCDPCNSEVVGPGFLYSTINDMTLWLDNFRRHTVGGDSLIERMLQKSKLSDGSDSFYGYGLGVEERDGKRVVGHSGQTGSFMSMVLYVPEDEIGITVLANNRRIRAEPLAYQILDAFYGKEREQEKAVPASEAKPVISFDFADKEGYAGAYLIDGTPMKLFVSCQEKGLYGIFDGRGSDFFYPLSDSQFVNDRRNVSFIIYFNADRKPMRVMLDIKGDTMWASRIDPPIMTPGRLAADYAGEYYSNALGIAYNISLDGDKLVIRHHRYSDRPIQLTDKDEFVGSIGIVRFSRNEQGLVESFAISDEDTNFKPLIFRRIF
jgi:CubicO group peptidase (beta-lactamase class C family)